MVQERAVHAKTYEDFQARVKTLKFFSVKEFSGRRPGYFFKHDVLGLGYYEDVEAQANIDDEADEEMETLHVSDKKREEAQQRKNELERHPDFLAIHMKKVFNYENQDSVLKKIRTENPLCFYIRDLDLQVTLRGGHREVQNLPEHIPDVEGMKEAVDNALGAL